MTSPLDHVRRAALALPEAEETHDDDVIGFEVGGRAFAIVSGMRLRVLADDEPEVFDTIDIGGEPDWVAIEDRLARGWELAAPRRLLEAGGR